MAADRGLSRWLHCCHHNLYARDDAGDRPTWAHHSNNSAVRHWVINRSSSREIAIAIAIGGSASTGSSCATETGWKRLTSEDIRRVKRALSARRAEALA